jgi:membrane protein DedA with SNARE-associated domain
VTGSQAATLTTTFAIVAPYVARYGYAAVIVGVGLESAGLPLPGETALLAASALAARGELNVWLVAAAGVAAAALGDNLGFAVGRIGGRRLLTWLEGRLLPRDAMARVDAFFARWGPASIIVARFVTGVRVVAALAAGASGMPWRVFLPFNAAGAVLWAAAVTAIGYLAGDVSVLHPGVMTVNRAVGVAVAAIGLSLAIRGAVLWARRRPAMGNEHADGVSHDTTE